MTRLPVLSGREIIKILSVNGFSIVGRKGSHIRLKRMTPDKVHVVIVPYHNDIPIEP